MREVGLEKSGILQIFKQSHCLLLAHICPPNSLICPHLEKKLSQKQILGPGNCEVGLEKAVK